MNLEDFKQPNPHRSKSTFEKYSIPKLADYLGITASYLSDILDGHIEPGNKLKRKIKTLTEEIQQEEIRLTIAKRNGPVLVKGFPNNSFYGRE